MLQASVFCAEAVGSIQVYGQSSNGGLPSPPLVTFTFPPYRFQSPNSNSTSLNVLANLEMALLHLIAFQKWNKNQDVNNLCGILWSFLSEGFTKLATPSILSDSIVLNWQLTKSIIWKHQGSRQNIRSQRDCVNFYPKGLHQPRNCTENTLSK